MSAGSPFADPLTRAIADFLGEIGIEVRPATLDRPTPCPGVWVERGVVLVDEGRLAHPGDLLHEAGHVAVCEPATRTQLAAIGDDPGEEMAAIAWSYAAAVRLGVDPAAVFHEAGYKGWSTSLMAALETGAIGVPLLAWYGLTLEAKAAAAAGAEPFPHMLRWLR